MMRFPLYHALHLARSRGFAVIPQVPDFESDDPWSIYLKRANKTVETFEGSKTVHEYLLLVAERESFEMLEAPHWHFLAPRVTRPIKSKPVYRKRGDQVDPYSDHHYKGHAPIYAGILRDEEQLTTL